MCLRVKGRMRELYQIYILIETVSVVTYYCASIICCTSTKICFRISVLIRRYAYGNLSIEIARAQAIIKRRNMCYYYDVDEFLSHKSNIACINEFQ